MATSRKRLDPRLIAGIIFLVAGAIYAATASPAIGMGLMVVGIALIGASVVAARKAAPPDDRVPPAP